MAENASENGNGAAAGPTNAVFARLANRSDRVRPAGLKEAFAQYGTVTKVNLIGRKGFAIVTFEDDDMAKSAIAAGSIECDTADGEGKATLTLEVVNSQPRPRGEKKKKKPAAANKRAKKQIDPERSLFVGDLPETFEKADLEAVFAEYGELESSTVSRRNAKGKSHAFVTFVDAESASKVLAAAGSDDGVKLNGETLVVEKRKIQPAPREKDAGEKKKKPAPKKALQTLVYLGNLSQTVDQDQLRSSLGEFGQVKNVSLIKRDGFASVEFETEAEMEAALAGTISWEGEELTVVAWKPTRAPKDGSKIRSHPIGKTLHVSSFSSAVTDDVLVSLFESFGKPKDVSVRPSRAFALVEFGDEASAQACVAKAGEEPGLGLPSQTESPVVVEMSESRKKPKQQKR